MEFNINHIWEGWRNHLVPPKDLKDLINKTTEERLSICKQCEYYSERGVIKKCTKCGCGFPAKAKCLACSCPIGKWEALTTKEEESTIKEEIKNEKG